MSWATNYRVFSADDPMQLDRLRRDQDQRELAALRQHHNATHSVYTAPGVCRLCGRPRFTQDGQLACGC